MTWLRQYGYWWVEAMLGVAAIFAPFAARLSGRPIPTLTDVLAGILLLGWAGFGAWRLGYEALRQPSPGAGRDQAR
jgi:4-amino-4-deoxy-L-arabinose transferase-like glycosyltransferase